MKGIVPGTKSDDVGKRSVEMCADFITKAISDADYPLVTIEGPCASGKTTLAQKRAEVLHGFAIHTDDFSFAQSILNQAQGPSRHTYRYISKSVQ